MSNTSNKQINDKNKTKERGQKKTFFKIQNSLNFLQENRHKPWSIRIRRAETVKTVVAAWPVHHGHSTTQDKGLPGTTQDTGLTWYNTAYTTPWYNTGHGTDLVQHRTRDSLVQHRTRG